MKKWISAYQEVVRKICGEPKGGFMTPSQHENARKRKKKRKRK